MKQTDKKKQNNKGFSLVELLVSIALLAILGIAISGFMSAVNRNYKRNQTEVDLQYEAQTVMNQLKDLMIDASKGISLVGAGTDQLDIYVYNDTTYERITWLKNEHSIYLKHYGKLDVAEASLNTATADLISDMVFDFVPDLSAANSRRTISFQMTLAKKADATQKYEATNRISLRNNVLINKSRSDVYAP